MATKGQKSASVDFSYLSDEKLGKGKKKVKEQAETEWKGPSHKERREEATAEKASKMAKKRSGGGKEEKVPLKKKIMGFVALLFICGVGFFQFLETMFGVIAGNGITVLDVHDTARLKEILFGGEPWLIYCVNNETQNHRLPKVLEDSGRQVRSSIGLNVGVLPCWDQTESGRSVAQRFKFSLKPPLSFLVANGNKPRIMSLAGVSKAEDIEKKAKPALKLQTHRIDALKRWPKLCTSRRTCIVIGHKHVAQRDVALNIVKPLMESHRAVQIVTLDTSFWSLKLDEPILKRRPPQVKGSYHADVLCLAREDGAKGNSTHRGDFLQDLDAGSAAAFLTACEKRQEGLLVKIGVPPRIKARPSKPKKVTAQPRPPPRKAPTPAPKPKDPRSSGGASSAKVDRVGSRAEMEKSAQEEALFEAIEEDEAADEDSSDEAGAEDSSDEVDSEGEDMDAEDAEPSEDEVEL